MTPLAQTLLTLVCMVLAFWWGRKEGEKVGFSDGVNSMAETLIITKIITRKDLEKLNEYGDFDDE